MPYYREISRANKALFFFLLDQSFSMRDLLGGSGSPKKDELAGAVNRWLMNLVIRATSGQGVKDWMDIGVLGYRTDDEGNPIIETAFSGQLREILKNDNRNLATIVEIADHPCHMENRERLLQDEETRDIIKLPCDVPVWVDPVAEGGTPLCHALHQAYGILEEWISKHPKSFPPIVINFTDGESQDGDPVSYADAIRSLSTEDGNVLLFSCHLSDTPTAPVVFPHSEALLPEGVARTLFRMSSFLPDNLYTNVLHEGVELEPGARGLTFNADLKLVLRFFDMGTRVASHLR